MVWCTKLVSFTLELELICRPLLSARRSPPLGAAGRRWPPAGNGPVGPMGPPGLHFCFMLEVKLICCPSAHPPSARRWAHGAHGPQFYVFGPDPRPHGPQFYLFASESGQVFSEVGYSHMYSAGDNNRPPPLDLGGGWAEAVGGS